MNLIIAFTFITSFVFACEVNITFTTARGLSLSLSSIEGELLEELESKNYLAVASATEELKVHFSKSNLGPKHRAKTSISYSKDGSLQNYTQGYGKSSRRSSRAYRLSRFKSSFSKALSHLPICP